MRASLAAACVLAAATASAAPPGPESSYALPRRGSGVLVRLANGQEISGVLLRADAEETWIGVDRGEVGVDSREIVSAGARRTPEEEFEQRERLLAAGDAAGFWSLSRWASERGLDASAREAARRAALANPDHAAARAFLGQEKVGGRWLDHEDALRAKGFVEFEGAWLTPKELTALLAGRRAEEKAESRRRAREAKAAYQAALERRLAAIEAQRDYSWVVSIAGRPLRKGDSYRMGVPAGPFSDAFNDSYFRDRLPVAGARR